MTLNTILLHLHLILVRFENTLSIKLSCFILEIHRCLWHCNFIPEKRLWKSANENNSYALLVHSNWNYFISAFPQLVRRPRCQETHRIFPYFILLKLAKLARPFQSSFITNCARTYIFFTKMEVSTLPSVLHQRCFSFQPENKWTTKEKEKRNMKALRSEISINLSKYILNCLPLYPKRVSTQPEDQIKFYTREE